MNNLFSITKRNNFMRHFGKKEKNLWFYTIYEIKYLLDLKIIKNHSILNLKKIKNFIKSKKFNLNYKKYKFIKNKNFNLLENQIFVHKKEFNRNKEKGKKILDVFIDDIVRFENDFVYCVRNEDDFFLLEIFETELSSETDPKNIKFSKI